MVRQDVSNAGQDASGAAKAVARVEAGIADAHGVQMRHPGLGRQDDKVAASGYLATISALGPSEAQKLELA